MPSYSGDFQKFDARIQRQRIFTSHFETSSFQKEDLKMNHELWQEPDGCQTFCLAGARGERARALMHPGAKLVWKVEAESHFEAMTLYYAYMQWGKYSSGFPEQDMIPYKERDWD